MSNACNIGGTKTGEYWRTIEMLMQKTNKSAEDIMYILYFLHDLQYDNKDLKEMANLIHEDLKQRKKI